MVGEEAYFVYFAEEMFFTSHRCLLGVLSTVILFSVAVGTPVYLAPSGATSWGGECDTLLCNSSFPCSIPSSSMFSQLNASCDIVFSAGDYSNAHLQWSSNAKLVNLTFGFSTFLDGFIRQRSQEKLLSSLESDFTANLRLTLHLNAENVGTPGNGPLDASFILHGISTHKHALNSVIISLGANGDLDAEISGLSFNSSSLALKSPGSAEADIEQCDFAFGSQSNSPLDMTSTVKAELDFEVVSVVGASTAPSFIKGGGNISIEFDDSAFNGPILLETTVDSARVKLDISRSNVSYSGSSLISVPQNSILEVRLSDKSLLRSLNGNRVAISQWKSCSDLKLSKLALTGLDMSVTSGKVSIDEISCDDCDLVLSYPILNATIQNSNFSIAAQGSLILHVGPEIYDGSFSFDQVRVQVEEEGVSRKPFQIHRRAGFENDYSFGDSLVTNMIWLGGQTKFHVEELTLTEYAGCLDSNDFAWFKSPLQTPMHRRDVTAHTSKTNPATSARDGIRFWTFHSVQLQNVFMGVDFVHYVVTEPMRGIEISHSYNDHAGALPDLLEISWGASSQPRLGELYPVFSDLDAMVRTTQASLQQDGPLRGLKLIPERTTSSFAFTLVPSNLTIPQTNLACPLDIPDHFKCINGVLVAFQDIEVEDIEFPPNPIVILGNLKVEEDIEFNGIRVDLNVTGCIEADSMEFKFEKNQNPADIVPENSPIVVARQSPSCPTSLSNIKLKTDQSSKYCKKVVATHTPILVYDGSMSVTFRLLKCPAPVGWIVLGVAVGLAVICAIVAGVWWIMQGKKNSGQSHAQSFQPMDSEELQSLDD